MNILSNKAGKKTKVGRIYPNTSSFYKIVRFPTLLTPTSKYFYTDISVIFVTFRNSDVPETSLLVSES